jgi:integrase
VSVEIGTGSRAGRPTASTLFPLDTTARAMKAWQESARTRLRAGIDADAEVRKAPPPATPLTLNDAAEKYLLTVTAMDSYESRAADLLAWRRAIGHTPIADLSANTLQLTWNDWVHAKVAKSTLNHRRTALLQCLTRTAPQLVAMAKEALPHQGKHKGTPKELPHATIRQILDAMPPSASAAFLRVFAETGVSPETLRRMAPDDVDEDRRQMTLPPREKGDGVAGATLPITRAGAAAFRLYRAAGWQSVTKQTLGIVWGRACAAVRKAGTRVPKCTPYILRHSYALRLLDASKGDLQALQEALQHADLETTLTYVRARVKRSVRAATDALDDADPAP